MCAGSSLPFGVMNVNVRASRRRKCPDHAPIVRERANEQNNQMRLASDLSGAAHLAGDCAMSCVRALACAIIMAIATFKFFVIIFLLRRPRRRL